MDMTFAKKYIKKEQLPPTATPPFVDILNVSRSFDCSATKNPVFMRVCGHFYFRPIPVISLCNKNSSHACMGAIFCCTNLMHSDESPLGDDFREGNEPCKYGNLKTWRELAHSYVFKLADL